MKLTVLGVPDGMEVEATHGGGLGQLAYYRTTAPCAIHKMHTPKSHINEIHHVWPWGDGGPDIPQNRIVVCATGHNNIHALIDLYRKYAKANEAERHWALVGWRRIQQQRMDPTL
jgi:hypothetical protein